MATRVPPAWVVRPLLATRNALARLHRRMVPAEVSLIERSLGVIDTKVIAVVADLGVADHLASGPRTADELAAACGADADALARILRYLVGRGVFRRTHDGRFRNNRLSTLLRDTPGSTRAWAQFYGAEWHIAGWNQLGHAARTGDAGIDAALGHSFWEYLTNVNPEAGIVFDAAMAGTSSFQITAVVRKYDWSSCTRLCDIGGGTGTLLAAILAAHPSVQGVLFDLPEVVAKATRILDAAGVTKRVEVIPGNFFVSVPEACDRYLLQAIVHDWDDDSCVQFLTRCRDALPPTGRVLILENVMPHHAGDHFTKAIDLEMLVDTGKGRERTADEFTKLFERAGLKVEKVIPIALSTLFVLDRPAASL